MELERALIAKVNRFLVEMGGAFAFMGNQFRRQSRSGRFWTAHLPDLVLLMTLRIADISHCNCRNIVLKPQEHWQGRRHRLNIYNDRGKAGRNAFLS